MNRTQRLPIQVVQQLSGHSNIDTTRKYHLTGRPQDVATAGLNRRHTDFPSNSLPVIRVMKNSCAPCVIPSATLRAGSERSAAQ